MNIWRFLNSRFVSSLCAAAVLVLSIWILARPLMNFADPFDGNYGQRMDALGRLQLLSFTEVPTAENQPQRFVGKVRNNSSQLITGVTSAVCFYDAKRELKDMFTKQLDGVSLLKPGQEAEFVIQRPSERGESNGSPSKTVVSHPELHFVDISIARGMP